MRILLIGLLALGSMSAFATECGFIFTGGNHFLKDELNVQRLLEKKGYSRDYTARESTKFGITFTKKASGGNARGEIIIHDINNRNNIYFANRIDRFYGDTAILTNEIKANYFYKRVIKLALKSVPACSKLLGGID